MKNIKAIIFDFGGVIYNIDFNKTCEVFNDLGIKDFAGMYSLKDANPIFQQLEKGELAGEEFYREFGKFTGVHLEDDQVDSALNALLLGYRTEALATLNAIKHKYKIYLLSNTNSIHHKAFTNSYKQEIGEGTLEGYFDKVYYSHVIGYRKPGKEAYEIVLKENNLAPGETLFIDDTEKNIEGARALGLQTILLKEGMGIEDLGL